MIGVFGILNITRDSFSDGGRWLDPADAIRHAETLLADGADVIDVGAESTHPRAEPVSAEEEIRRLTPVVTHLKQRGATVSIDTHKPEVMGRMLGLGADIINDVTALRDPAAAAVLCGGSARIVLMHAIGTPDSARAAGADVDPGTLIGRIVAFFEERIATLAAAGIARDRLILDPGMGFFVGRSAEASLTILRRLSELTVFNLPLLVSVARKSFIGQVIHPERPPRPPAERDAGTLVAELWAADHGANFIRTHRPRPLRDALAVLAAIRATCSKLGPNL